MVEEKIRETMHSINVLQKAVIRMFSELSKGNKTIFYEYTEKLDIIMANLEKEGQRQKQEYKGLKLDKAANCCRYSLNRIVKYSYYNPSLALNKIEFELVPFTDDMYEEYYFWTCIFPFREKWDDYYRNEMPQLLKNPYLENARKTGKYKYDLSIMVLAYNQLATTKLCVMNLINNIPRDFRCELILINNGSTDETKEYFESIMPTKQIDIQENFAFFRLVERIIEGEFFLAVSNDIVVMPHAIENMLRTFEEDPKIVRVVPTTPNVSNHQMIEGEFKTFDEMITWAKKNNVYDPYRHELRTRLVNPIEMVRSID